MKKEARRTSRQCGSSVIVRGYCSSIPASASAKPRDRTFADPHDIQHAVSGKIRDCNTCDPAPEIYFIWTHPKTPLFAKTTAP
jgi:hypothetical protein